MAIFIQVKKFSLFTIGSKDSLKSITLRTEYDVLQIRIRHYLLKCGDPTTYTICTKAGTNSNITENLVLESDLSKFKGRLNFLTNKGKLDAANSYYRLIVQIFSSLSLAFKQQKLPICFISWQESWLPFMQ